MGLYLETGTNFGKVQELVDGLDAEVISQPVTFDPPEDKVLVCVVQNPFFEAAGVCPDKREFQAFSEPDGRPRTWLLIDRAAVIGMLYDQGVDRNKLVYYGLVPSDA